MKLFVQATALLLTAVTAALEVTDFSLWDAKNDIFIGRLKNDSVIDLSLHGKKLSVTAQVTGSATYVAFELDEVAIRNESVAPYSLGGDVGVNYKPVRALATKGDHIVTATAFDTATNETHSKTVSFTVVKQLADVDTPGKYQHSPAGELNGELKKWHKITIGFDGPWTNESATPNPFTEYRMDVRFFHNETSKEYTVPGFYAADGNAANTGASSGNVWLVHFVPDEIGTWVWNASFVQGPRIAQSDEDGLTAGFFDGETGSFDVQPTDKSGRDLRGKGRLQYVGEHHQRFAETGEWFVKVGADSPENFLSYEDFDNTPNYDGLRKSWAPHLQDYCVGDPTWSGGKGRAIIGVINYLSGMEMNAFSFSVMSILGDDQNVFPYVSDIDSNITDNYERIDVSKVSQWAIVLEHGTHHGMYLHVKTQEHENDQLLDGGFLGNQRKLFYRELIARFGFNLAMNFNLGEENTNHILRIESYCDHFETLDPYGHTVALHTYPHQKEKFYTPLLGRPTFDAVSLQGKRWFVFNETLEWVQKSADAGRKWIVSHDEANPYGVGVLPDDVDPDHTLIRKDALYGNLMAGGSGVEWYYGVKYPNSDITAQDHRSRELMWIQSRYALEFFKMFSVPFWAMSNANHLVSFHESAGIVRGRDNKYWCLTTRPGSNVNTTIAVYLRRGDSVNVNLKNSNNNVCSTGYTVGWYDVRNGGSLQNGTFTFLSSNGTQFLGRPPYDNDVDEDWMVLLNCDD